MLQPTAGTVRVGDRDVGGLTPEEIGDCFGYVDQDSHVFSGPWRELGSAVAAARLVRDLMRLCLLINRCYPPYDKWLGSSFARLSCAAAHPS